MTSSNQAAPPPTPAPLVCPVCQATTSGKFCSNCGAPLAGATCANCSAALTPGAKFCHRCGTPARPALVAADQRSFSSALPWTIAGIALVALIALVAAQRFRQTANPTPGETSGAAGPFQTNAAGQPPDISRLTPNEAAIRLYDRVMGAHERGQQDTVAIFAPMAIAAYQMIGNLDPDQRYDLGRIGAVSGDTALARAQADTILARNPNHLLGLILASSAARVRRDTTAAGQYQRRLVAAAASERAKQLPEYVTHQNDITLALEQAKRP